jgi:predicted metal-dependent hydrolase
LVRNLDDKEAAAKLLSDICSRLSKLVDHLNDNIDAKDNNKEIKAGIKRMKKNYDPNNIVESSPGNKYTSYSINKGEKIVFCLRSKDKDQALVDLNTMMFVAIHELAHLMSKDIGHTKEFWDNMKFLLKKGIEIDIYTKQDFNSVPVEYCGTMITDTPLNS